MWRRRRRRGVEGGGLGGRRLCPPGKVGGEAGQARPRPPPQLEERELAEEGDESQVRDNWGNNLNNNLCEIYYFIYCEL